MNKAVVYKNNDGGISILHPTDCGMTIEEIAKKDVPSGCEYYIIDVSQIPTDRSFRSAWTWE